MPHFTAEKGASEESAQLAAGVGHSCYLTVRAVQDYGEELDQYAYEVDQNVLRKEEETSYDAEEQRKQGNGVRAYLVLNEEVRKEHGKGAVYDGIELILYVVGFLRGLQVPLKLFVPLLDPFDLGSLCCSVMVVA